MVFSLEALHAMQGDSLLLHYGSKEEPRLIVIDGGPPTVYLNALRPRLEKLRAEAGGVLPIEILMVSHIDGDHIRGLIDFSDELIREPERQADHPVGTLWHNAFEDVLAGVEGIKEAAAFPAAPPEMKLEVATVEEGGELRDNARTLHWRVNEGFDGFVVAPETGGAVPDLELGPLKLTVVGPRHDELEKLRKTWEAWVKDQIEKGELEPAATPDTSPSNLSSIVCVVEQGGKRMLLTGDARGDKVLKQLEAAGFMEEGGVMELDLLKVPHHGSSRNVKPGFFKRLPAKHLVISADGEHENPDIETLKMISEDREGDDGFTIYLTEPEFKEGMGPRIEEFFREEKAKGRGYKVVFLPAAEPALRIDL